MRRDAQIDGQDQGGSRKAENKGPDRIVTDKRADHENIAVGEINEAQNAIDHGVAQGEQGVNRPQGKAVDQLL